MADARRESVYSIKDSLSPTDQELFSLFLQYPEIDFDSYEIGSINDEHSSDGLANLDSSPMSTAPAASSGDSTLISCDDASSFRTTPSRLAGDAPTLLRRTPSADWTEFVQLLLRSDLPQRCLRYYILLGQCSIAIGAELFTIASKRHISKICRTASKLLENVTYSCNAAASQVRKVEDLKSRVAFMIKPTTPFLWSTYMQRVKLITANLALPSERELCLVQSLVLMYDVNVYTKIRSRQFLTTIDQGIVKILTCIYHTSITWQHNYKRWCDGMASLRHDYMMPLIDEFTRSQEAQAEFNDFQDRLHKARASLSKPIDGKEQISEKMVQTFNLRARQPELAVPQKSASAK